MLSEDDARDRALAWARQHGSATTVELTAVGDAWLIEATPPAGSVWAGRQLVAVLPATGDLQPWPELPAADVRAALGADPAGHDPRVTALLRAAGWSPGRRLADDELAAWETEVARLHEEVPLTAPHDTARGALQELGGTVLTAPGRAAVHVLPAAHRFDPVGADLAAEVLAEPVAPVAVVADDWPTELFQGVSGAVVAVQVGEGYRVGGTLDEALCTVVGLGRWVQVEVA